MLAFFGISSLVVIAAVIAILSLSVNTQNLDRISRQSIPIATNSLDLTRTAQKIVDVVPQLVSTETAAGQELLKIQLASEIERLNTLLDALHEFSVDPRAAASIDRAASQFSANIEAIDRVVTARLAIGKSQNGLLEQGQQALESIAALLAVNLGNDVSRVLSADPQIANRQFRFADAAANVREMGLLLKIQIAPEAQDVREVASETLDQIRQILPDIEPAQSDEFKESLDILSSLYDGSNNLIQQEAFRLQLETAADMALQENTGLAKRFAEAVDRMVNVAKADVVIANERAASVQKVASGLLISVVLATLVSLLLIMRFYVQRSILTRLTDLTSAMMAIANGNLKADIPKGSEDELGTMAQALRVFRDTAIDFRDSSMREIHEVRSRLDHAIESIQEGFALFDADDRLVLSNSQFSELLFEGKTAPRIGTGYAEFVKERLSRVIVMENIGEQEWIKTTLDYHRTPSGTNLLELNADRWVNATERKTEDGGTVMVITDITALKRHERELDELVEQLRKASEAKSSFIANVSHELRTPLTAILGFTQIVQSRLEKTIFPNVAANNRATDRALAQVRENIGIIIREGERLTKMINDILDLEKIEAGQMVWNIENLNIGAIIEQASAATTSLYKKKKLEFQIDIEDDLPWVIGDHDRLVQVVINLISNAVKFTDRGHVVCRAIHGEGPFVSISVTDTGSGISPEDQAEVFDKFRQVGDTLTEKPTGTGLGLPICREIVEHLGGSITVESILNFGSTFTFQIPTAKLGATAI
ncbi:hypothetical protein A9Q96_00420 [Rhodobacterales bacterium 52_120_T64]|nr:hypothetical protein A9Q96_00420 [Rhodobacterales bacterium 52_120_T64]